VGNYDFPEAQTKKLKRVMGYNTHRIAKSTSSPSDFCIFGLNYLLDNGLINRNEIGAIISVGVVPDFFMPHISTIVQGECKLSKDTLCFDISQGCLGFLIGLLQGYMLLEHLSNKKIILMNTDVLSHKTSNRDRNSYPIVGDVTTLTVLENDNTNQKTYFNIMFDGTRRDALRIPAGGDKMPCNVGTAKMVRDGEGNYRSLDNLVMDGTAVFQFVQRDVPPLIDETFAYAGLNKDEMDWFLFHQPNRFMLQKLADRIGVPREKVPMGIVEKYGNPSGASIPLVIADQFREKMCENDFKCCLSAFGSGLAWGGCILSLSHFDFCEIIVSNL
jgi:3-oxoacyl-[acyl-carrier-protein] synthase-3